MKKLKELFKQISLCFLLIGSIAYAQNNNSICGNEQPNIPNELLGLLAQEKTPTDNCSYYLKVQFHFLRTSNGFSDLFTNLSGEPFWSEEQVITTVMENLSEVYAPLGIHFIQQDAPNYIDDDALYNYENTTVFGHQQSLDLLMTHENGLSSADVIDIYLCDGTFSQEGGSSKPYWNTNYIDNPGFYVGGSYTIPEQEGASNEASTMAPPKLALTNIVCHEMGHILGLRHVFENTAFF